MHEAHKVAVKLMQSKAWKAYTFKNHSSGRIQCWLVPLLCPLYGLDSGTGENVKASIEESLHVPFDPLTDDQYTFTTAAFTLDRDGANNRAVKGIEGEEPQTPIMHHALALLHTHSQHIRRSSSQFHRRRPHRGHWPLIVTELYRGG